MCKLSTNECVECLDNSDCSLVNDEVCYLGDNKCYSSENIYGNDCAADNGDNVDARCASGICRSTDKKCGCDVNTPHLSREHGIDCPCNQICSPTNTCVYQRYRLVTSCLGVGNEGTNSNVRLNVIRNDGYSILTKVMDKDDAGCPWLEFDLDANWCTQSGRPKYFDIEILANDALGVDYFTLWDMIENVKVMQWGAEGGGGWCLSTDGEEGCWDSVSGAGYPVLGVILNIDGSSQSIKFGKYELCNDDSSCYSGNCQQAPLFGSCEAWRRCCVDVSITSQSCFVLSLLISCWPTFFSYCIVVHYFIYQ